MHTLASLLPSPGAGFTSQPGIAFILSGQPTIVTQDSGATTIRLSITLPTNNSGAGQQRARTCTAGTEYNSRGLELAVKM